MRSRWHSLRRTVAGALWAGVLAAGVAFSPAARADFLISEFVAVNDTGLRDENGTCSDWIEIYNRAGTNANIGGYALTDDADDPLKWVLPATNLPPHGCLVVFASDKNRRTPGAPLHTNFKLGGDGEYLALVAPDGVTVVHAYAPAYPPQVKDVSYGLNWQTNSATLLRAGAPAVAHVPANASLGTTWTARTGFDDSGWLAGYTGIGYDTETTYDSLLGFDLQGRMLGINATVYARIPFTNSLPATVSKLTLNLRYEDGFVAYLNGQKVASAAAPASPAWNSQASGSRADSAAVAPAAFDLTTYATLLTGGTNILAVQVLNSSSASGDLLFLPELVADAYDVDPATARYFATPTPGAPNAGGYLGLVADTKFSVDRGFYTNAFTVTITSATDRAVIYYTANAEEPSPTRFTGVGTNRVTVAIAGTTVLRAVAHKPGYRPTDVDTQTYIFLAQVARQPAAPAGYPATWVTAGGFSVNADYEMDPDITRAAATSNNLPRALLAIPTLSIVTAVSNLFSRTTGIYANSSQDGAAWERPVSLEFISPGDDRNAEFQANCGLRIQGGYFRAETVTRKHSFRLVFRSVYGLGKLTRTFFDDPTEAGTYDSITLRAGANDSYCWNAASNTEQYVRDEFGRSLCRAAGIAASHGRLVHLYVNGLYWGLYNPIEQPDASFAANYHGGDKEFWDAIHEGAAADGTVTAWNTMLATCNAGLSTLPAYMAIQGRKADGSLNPAGTNLLDVANYIGYMLVNIWGGNWDWPNKNYWAARDRSLASTGFKFHSWDFENTMGNDRNRSPLNMVSPRAGVIGQGVGLPHEKLKANAEYRLAFADAAHRCLFNGGILTPAALIARYTNVAAAAELAIIGESARWGDHQYATAPLTQARWLTERTWVTGTYLPARSAIVLQQLQTDGLYPSLAAPVFNINGSYQHGGAVAAGAQLTLTAPDAAYYTLDGSDPRTFGTGVARGTRYTGALRLNRTTRVKARTLSAGVWSALNEALYVTDDAIRGLRMTEIMPHAARPAGAEADVATAHDAFEFIEFRNASTGIVCLTGLRLTDGVQFDFSASPVQLLGPGEHVVVVENLAAFAARYPTNGLLVAGVYSGGLDDAGETVRLADALDRDVCVCTYALGRGWPAAAGGAGHSLVPVSLAVTEQGLDYGGNWRASTYIGGSPGRADPAPVHDVVLNEIMAHTDYVNPERPAYDSNDWIELFNAGAQAVNLGGWYLSDDAADLRKWAIPATNVIATLGWLAFDEVTGFHAPIDSGFGLSKFGETIYLAHLPGNGQDRVADAVAFKGQANGVTLGRCPDGAEAWQALAATRAAANAAAGAHVLISELMYHPAPTAAHPEDNTNDEFIELHNPTAADVLLMGETGPWRVDGPDYTFPSNTVLAAGAYAVVVNFDPVTNAAARAAFGAAHGLTNGQARLFGPYAGKLSNRGERIALERPIAPDLPGDPLGWEIVDEVIYFDRAPWPEGADGSGRPLRRAGVGGAGNVPDSWVLGLSATPGRGPALVEIIAPLSGSVHDVPITQIARAAVDESGIGAAVARVDFLAETTLLASDATAPYTAELAALRSEGTYQLTAVVVDAAGRSHTSAVCRITVNGLPPAAHTHRLKLTCTGYSGTTTLTDFPVPVRLGAHIAGFQYAQFAGPGGADLRFMDATETRPLSYEVETWDTNGVSLVWVRVPQLAPGGFFWARWGTPTLLTRPPYTQDGSTWRNGYAGVWHFQDGLADSTSNRLAAVNHGSTPGTGLAGGGRAFAAAASSYVEPGIPAAWIQANQDQLTVSAWCYRQTEGSYGVFGCDSATSAGKLLLESNGRLVWRLAAQAATGTAAARLTAWDHLGLVLSRGQAYGYVNGLALAMGACGGIVPTGAPLLGCRNVDGTPSGFLTGKVDELRVARAARSADWMRAEYQSLSPTPAFLTAELRLSYTVDADADRLPDQWEIEQFGATNALQGGAAEDRDSDGLSNNAEYIAGTDPLNAHSAFTVALRWTNGLPAVRFDTVRADETVAGWLRCYALDNCTSLANHAWQSVGGFERILGTNQTVWYTNQVVRPRFFRGRVWLEEEER